MKLHTWFSWGQWSIGLVIDRLHIMKSDDDIPDDAPAGEWWKGRIYQVTLCLPLIRIYFYTGERYYERTDVV